MEKDRNMKIFNTMQRKKELGQGNVDQTKMAATS